MMASTHELMLLLLGLNALLVAFLCRTLLSVRRELGRGLRVHVPELSETSYSLNAMRTHLYQIGRALRHRKDTPGSLDGDGSFFEYSASKKTE